jgi:hypothetical protein
MGDAEYIYAFQKVIMPIAMEFAPELVISKVFIILITLSNLINLTQYPPGLTQQLEMTWENVLSHQLAMHI